MRKAIHASLAVMLLGTVPASAQQGPVTLVFENQSTSLFYYSVYSQQRGYLVAETTIGGKQTHQVSVSNPVPASPTRSILTVGHGNTGWCYFDVHWPDPSAGVMHCEPRAGYQPACAAFQGCTGATANSHTFIRLP